MRHYFHNIMKPTSIINMNYGFYSITLFAGQKIELGPVSSDIYIFSTNSQNLNDTSNASGFYYISRATQDSQEVFQSMP